MPLFVIEKTDLESKESPVLDRQLRSNGKASFVYQLEN